MRKNYQDFRIDETDFEVKILYYFGSEDSIIIPAEIHGKPVTALGDEAFLCADSIFAEGLRRKLSQRALRHIVLPDGLKMIGNAFKGCEALEELVIPAAVDTIGSLCFTRCTNLSRIEVAAENATFSSRSGILYSKKGDVLILCPPQCLSVPDDVFQGVSEIRPNAFACCNALKKAIFPESVTTIGFSAFRECRCLETLQLHPGITLEGTGHFGRCTSLTKVEFFNREPVVPAWCFHECTRLQEITFGSAVEIIQDNAFRETGLTQIVIPDNTKRILHTAFFECFNLKQVTIPKSVIYISSDCAFTRCGVGASDTAKEMAPVRYNSGRVSDADCEFIVFHGSAAEKFCNENQYKVSYI